MVVQIQKFQKFISNTSGDVIRYFSAVASEDPVGSFDAAAACHRLSKIINGDYEYHFKLPALNPWRISDFQLPYTLFPDTQ